MASLTLPPDYFRTAAELYREHPSNRKVWLQDQINKAGQSLLQYQAELNAITVSLANLQARSGDGKLITVSGGVLAAIPGGYTQVIGGILMVAGSLFSGLENKKKLAKIEELRKIGLDRYDEAVLVAGYQSRYKQELAVLKILPIILTAILIYLIVT